MADISHYADGRFFPRSGLQWAFYPFWWLWRHAGLVAEYPFADWRLALVMVAGALAAVAFVLRPRSSRYQFSRPGLWLSLLGFWVTGYLLWLRTFSIYRYAIPLEVIGGILFVGAICFIWRTQRWMAAGTTIAALILLSATTVYPNWGHIAFQDRSVPVDPPAIPENSLLVLSGFYPMAYVAALAPPSVRAVGAYTDFVRPPYGAGTTKRIEALVAEWQGPIRVVRTRVPDLESRSVITTGWKCHWPARSSARPGTMMP